jgi:lipopolysaccharide transport system ATP-binding protein
VSKAVVKVEGLSKQYRIGTQVNRHGRFSETMWEAVTSSFRRRNGPQSIASAGSREEFWALRDLSFELEEGEVLGIVGRNGAGKTTLLKILARITEPTSGRAELYGRVGALLEVGTGFHLELTGRENVFLNGAVLGMSRAEIRAKFDEIVDFAGEGVERFIDTPVKRYSTGMRVRLAFAVAAHLQPEILIVDEVLAVGDVAFQKKSVGKMNEVARSGRTVLFVSHNSGAVAELCSRAILLEHGRMVADGGVSDVLSQYSRLIASHQGQQAELRSDPNLPCSILRVAITGPNEKTGTVFDLSDELTLTVTYEVKERQFGLQLATTLSRNGIPLLQTFDTDNDEGIPVREPGLYEACYVIPGMFLKAGMFTVDLTLGTPQQLFQSFESIAQFDIEELSTNAHMKGYRRDRLGHVIAPGSWETERVGETETNLLQPR